MLRFYRARFLERSVARGRVSLLRELLLTLLLLLLLAHTPARAQIVADTTHGVVGKTVQATFRLATNGNDYHGVMTLRGTMQLSNPTVFYPERFIAPEGDSVIAFELKGVKDSIYTISVTLRRDSTNSTRGDTLFYLAGEALAGSDSICRLTFRDITINEMAGNIAPGAIITRSIGPPLPYVRFAILEQNYPNPVPRGGTTKWAFRIDKRSDVRFSFYNLLSEELFTVNLGDLDIGPHTFTLTPQLDMPTGVYLVRMTTNSGSVDQVMHILR